MGSAHPLAARSQAQELAATTPAVIECGLNFDETNQRMPQLR